MYNAGETFEMLNTACGDNCRNDDVFQLLMNMASTKHR